MGLKKNITPQTREIIARLSRRGMSQVEIANLLKLSRCAIQNALKIVKETKKYDSRPRKPRKRKTTPREDRSLVVMSLKNRRLGSKELTGRFNEQFNKNISPRTIRRRLNKAGLRGCKARKKPWLSPKNISKRYKWAKEHQNWSYEDWSRVVWSDESNIEVSSNNIF